MYIIIIDESTCEGCNECCENCPVGILALNADKKAEVVGDVTECAGCESCTTVCKTGSITLQEI